MKQARTAYSEVDTGLIVEIVFDTREEEIGSVYVWGDRLKVVWY